MQSIKITIPGYFWDTQLYKGWLYLFELDGSMSKINWESLINTINVPDNCRLALDCAFLRNDYLYGSNWERLFNDIEFLDLLKRKFDLLSNQQLVVNDIRDIANNSIDSPFPYAHNDVICYKDTMYGSSQSGVFSHPLSDKLKQYGWKQKIWDAPVSDIDVKLDVLALAAGDEGLYRAPTHSYFGSTSTHQEPKLQSDRLCNSCNYVHNSILIYGQDEGAEIIEFISPRQIQGPIKSESYFLENPLRRIDDEDLFQSSTEDAYIWGSNYQLCMAKDGYVFTTNYNPPKNRRTKITTQERKHLISPLKGSPVSGNNAIFGSVLELDNCLLVIRSDNQIDTINGEPTNWRVFPNSKFYVNHLHVIQDDRLEIYSFNHDFFLNQTNKLFGDPYKDVVNSPYRFR